MEIKDLILLMFIPILLVSLVVYVDNSPAIIGAVTADNKESNILGTYSVNPSFRAKVEYNLDDYSKIKDLLDIISNCAQNKNVQDCVNDINTNDNQFVWYLGCDRGAEKVLYDFAEFMQNCIDSDDNNCLCNKKFELSIDKIKELGLSGNFELGIKEDSSARKLNLEFLNPKTDLAYDVNINGISGIIPRRYFFSYSGDKPIINLIFTDLNGIQSGLGPLNELIIYKNDDNKDKTKSIDFVKQEGDNLVYPEPQPESEYSTSIPLIKTVKKSDLHSCQIKPKNIYKFCTTKKDYKIMAYDKLDGQVKERPVTIKFASYVPQIPPPPLTNIQIFDKPKAEKSVIVKWDKSTKDAAKYGIYYGKSLSNIFDGKISLSDIKKKEGFNKKEIDIAKPNPIEVSQIQLDKCIFDFASKGCSYKTADAQIIVDKEKLYYDKPNNYYLYVINVGDNVDYDFTVTAIDKVGNEIDNVKQKLNVVKNAKSVDDLPPDSSNLVILRLQQIYESSSKKVTFNFGNSPQNNIDGSPLSDFKNYKIYYVKYDSLTLQQKSEAVNSIMDGKLSTITFVQEVNYDQQLKSFSIDISSTNPQSNNVYFFIIVAQDTSGNPKEDNFKVKELGAIPLQLIIP